MIENLNPETEGIDLISLFYQAVRWQWMGCSEEDAIELAQIPPGLFYQYRSLYDQLKKGITTPYA